jgi:hypothetical protein
MSSLKERIELLENDLKAVPSRISVYHDLPFAILRYDPTDEWELRREVKLLATRLVATGKEANEIRMSELFLCPLKARSSFPVAASHRRAVWSHDPVSTRARSGLKATEATPSLCPLKARSSFPVAASHRRAVLSDDPVSTRAIGAEGNGPDSVLMPLEGTDFLPHCSVPQAGGVVP